jgi:hypothetical protein
VPADVTVPLLGIRPVSPASGRCPQRSVVPDADTQIRVSQIDARNKVAIFVAYVELLRVTNHRICRSAHVDPTIGTIGPTGAVEW